MMPQPELTEDMHVHSTFSDGKHSVEENARSAGNNGILRLGCVDHVRRDTPWVAQFSQHVAELGRHFELELNCGVEAKLLDEAGHLDMPRDLPGVDYILAADHQLPFRGALMAPQVLKDELRSGRIDEREPAEALMRAYEGVMRRYENVILAHPFSILRRAGISESVYSDGDLHRLARVARETGCQIEVSERWRCPSARTIRSFADAKVRIRVSSDSHRCQTIGQYDYVRRAIEGAFS